MSKKIEFRISKYLTLRLEKNLGPILTDGKTWETHIYVEGKYFRQCKFLLLTAEDETLFDEIESIDEAAERLDKTQKPIEGYIPIIPHEVEFWGHCSNLQVWYENNYDTCLLHSNLAFPLLKRLTEVGDLLAIKVFKEEISKRLAQGYMPVIHFLEQESYLKYLTYEEKITALLEPQEANAILELEEILNEKFEIQFTDPTYTRVVNNPNIVINNKHVIGLKASKCNLEEIKDRVKILKKIRYLNLRFEPARGFPDFILSLLDLEHFLIDGLEIDQIPDEICKLKSLIRVYFRECKVKKLPPCLEQLKDLKSIDLYYEFLDIESKKLLNIINKK